MSITDQWLNVAKAELNGENAFEKLSIQKKNITIKPWYDASSVPQGQSFILSQGNSWLGPRAWIDAPLVRVTDCATANKKALNLLSSGADGILFDGGDDLETLLKGIQTEYCYIAFKEKTELTEISDDFFLEIARLKNLRKQNPGIFIHAYIKPFSKEAYQPHGNMISSTSRALAAVLGGCDALTIETSSELEERIAKNVSLILREESHIIKQQMLQREVISSIL
ncbi:MAG: methylmalonyl-CoA mutase family protein [Bacteroidota bacterium]